MKKTINIFMLFILSIVFILGGTACGSSRRTESSWLSMSGNQTSAKSISSFTEATVSDSQISEANSPDEATLSSSQIPEVSSSDETTAKSDRQIIAAILMEKYGSSEYSEGNAIQDADKMVGDAEKLPNRYLGKITSEQDAKKKAEAFLITTGGSGSTIDYKPYKAKFYDQYGVWLVEGTLSPNAPGEVPWVVIQESDGKVLAAS